jgi:hypothetical protein
LENLLQGSKIFEEGDDKVNLEESKMDERE